jgi:hypothetical protein
MNKFVDVRSKSASVLNAVLVVGALGLLIASSAPAKHASHDVPRADKFDQIFEFTTTCSPEHRARLHLFQQGTVVDRYLAVESLEGPMLVANAQLTHANGGTIVLHVGDLPAECTFVLDKDLGIYQACNYQGKSICSARLSDLE